MRPLFFDSDVQLEDAIAVYKLRETLIHSLHEYVSALRPFNSVNHLSQIYLCMPLLRQLDAVTRRYWNSIRREGKVPMNKLFVEMLESNITMRWQLVNVNETIHSSNLVEENDNLKTI